MTALSDAFHAQSDACAALGSPFMVRLMRLCGARLTAGGDPLRRKLFTWPGDVGPAGHSLPLRLASGLHALVISGKAPSLAACYPLQPIPSDEVLWAEVEAALDTHNAWLTRWIDRPPQTNEVRRSAVFVAAARWLAARVGLPLALYELGASAGLNLHLDHVAVQTERGGFGAADPALTLSPRWEGALPPDDPYEIASKAGCDLTPLDVQNPNDRLRLFACLWPDQPERRERTEKLAALPPATLTQTDALNGLQAFLAEPHPGAVRVILHSVAWQYFPKEVQEAGAALICAAGQEATEECPLAWLSMEADGSDAPGAGLSLRLWPQEKGGPGSIGRASFHGDWVRWDAPEPQGGA